MDRVTGMGRVSMKQYDIPSLISQLIGGVEPIADSAYDKKVLENLKEYTEVLSTMIDNVMYASNYRTSQYGSMEDVGDYAYKWLLDIKQEIEEYCEDYEPKGRSNEER